MHDTLLLNFQLYPRILHRGPSGSEYCSRLVFTQLLKAVLVDAGRHVLPDWFLEGGEKDLRVFYSG